MHELAYFIPASSHGFKPRPRNSSQLTPMRLYPCVDGGIARDCAVQSE